MYRVFLEEYEEKYKKGYRGCSKKITYKDQPALGSTTEVMGRTDEYCYVMSLPFLTTMLEFSRIKRKRKLNTRKL